ncbi:hypothetical protein PM082_009344 [Marasmius tenuissimus]|nr:hypothetical protein PM082_009344 [Marasmius tenuissimus]
MAAYISVEPVSRALLQRGRGGIGDKAGRDRWAMSYAKHYSTAVESRCSGCYSTSLTLHSGMVMYDDSHAGYMRLKTSTSLIVVQNDPPKRQEPAKRLFCS